MLVSWKYVTRIETLRFATVTKPGRLGRLLSDLLLGLVLFSPLRLPRNQDQSFVRCLLSKHLQSDITRNQLRVHHVQITDTATSNYRVVHAKWADTDHRLCSVDSSRLVERFRLPAGFLVDETHLVDSTNSRDGTARLAGVVRFSAQLVRFRIFELRATIRTCLPDTLIDVLWKLIRTGRRMIAGQVYAIFIERTVIRRRLADARVVYVVIIFTLDSVARTGHTVQPVDKYLRLRTAAGQTVHDGSLRTSMTARRFRVRRLAIVHWNDGRRAGCQNCFIVLRNLIQLVVLVLLLRDQSRLIGERGFHSLNVIRVIRPRVRGRYDSLRGRDRVFRGLKCRHVATSRRIVPGRCSVSVAGSQTVRGSHILEFLQVHVG